MTLQQLEYVVAVDKHRHFVRAAKECSVTQSTLSSMIQKLEAELDVVIFNRKAHPVEPTELGVQIIKQAKVLLHNASQLHELTLSEKQQCSGKVRLGIIPTIAPYIVPSLIEYIHTEHPSINLTIIENTTANLIKALEAAEVDMALLATPLEQIGLLEVPIYYEKFIGYVAEDSPLFDKDYIEAHDISSHNMWVLKEGHCLRNQVINFCENDSSHSTIYEAGSIDTLIRIVDKNGGHTIIPELHTASLNQAQRRRVRRIKSPEPLREVSLTIREDYVREKILNIIAQGVKNSVPSEMVNPRLQKFRIKL